ncbi:hypothetical protein MVEN_02314500 [Mycena venus]|uniref:Uncharacterized protein n=1 Tax=Mycena venus TaxID=2733690 RepID=A0A8H6X4A7_9AGAR|nr:hypothetical protein MVEN_02314500 [Mycena venus]
MCRPTRQLTSLSHLEPISTLPIGVSQNSKASRLTERQASHPAPQSVPDDSIPRPRNASKIPMREIFRLLGYDKAKWNALRAYVRDALLAACLHWDLEWKAQRPEKQSRAYNAIEDAFPETRRFANQWAIDRIAKQFWDNHKTYRNCVGNDSTYRGRQAAARRADHPLPDPQSLSPIPLDSVRSRSRSRDPTPGPSRPRRLARSNVINSDDDDSGSDDDDCDDDPLVCHDDDDDDDDDDVEEEEEEEDVSGKGKAKAKAPGKRAAPSQSGPTSKRRRS